MVMVRLKGVYVVRRRLAGGAEAEYHYAWKGKGAPRLQGAPGSPEYVSSYQSAHAGRKRPQTGTLRQLIASYQASPEYRVLGDDSKRAYGRYLSELDAFCGTLPIKALDDENVGKTFVRWRNTMADRPRTADYAMSALKRLLSWAVENFEIRHNHAERIGRLHRVDKSEAIWTEADFAAFVGAASKELRWAVELAAHTGLRQGDLTRLTWGAYDGSSFVMRTSKRGRDVIIPATKACQALMKRIEKRQVVILTTERGKRRWTTDGLRSSFGEACKRAGVKRTFHDLRRTAATNLLIAGLESSQVAMIMGWSEEAVESLKRKYISRSAVVLAALAKLEKSD